MEKHTVPTIDPQQPTTKQPPVHSVEDTPGGNERLRSAEELAQGTSTTARSRSYRSPLRPCAAPTSPENAAGHPQHQGLQGLRRTRGPGSARDLTADGSDSGNAPRLP
jgi:hypothetical protein